MDAIQRRGADGQGASHRFLDEVHSPGGGLGKGLPPEKAAQQHGGKEVPGTEKMAWLQGRHSEADLAAAAVQTAGAQGFWGEADAGDHHGAFPIQGEAAEPLLHTGLAGGNAVKGLPQKKGGLGEVRGDEVGLGGQPDHLFTHLRGVGAVDTAVIAHDGIDQDQSLLPAQTVDQALEDIDLLERAQEAGVNGVKGGMQGLPMD